MSCLSPLLKIGMTFATWCNFQQTADVETTHLQGRNNGKAQISPSEKASWHTMGCGRSGIKEFVHRNYRSTPRLWINNMLISVKDIELYTRSSTESSIKTNYWVNEINSN